MEKHVPGRFIPGLGLRCIYKSKAMKKIILLATCIFNIASMYAQNVGIGTTSPAFKLDVSGSINTDSLYRISGVAVLSVKGTANTLLGIASGYSITSGTSNTALGFNSLVTNSTGNFNAATGRESLFSNISGSYNVANGGFTLYHNTNGICNTAVGHQSLLWNTTGDYNTALGYLSLYNNTDGNSNVGIGRMALTYCTSGSSNTAIGNLALLNTKTSSGNTAVGAGAGDSFDNGYYNTFLGSDADANGAGYYNSIAIGNSSTVTAPVQVRIGGSFITSIGGYQNWTNISDGRYKRNIHEDVKGLDFIMKLKPVTYNLDVTGISERLDENRGKQASQAVLQSIAEKEKILYSGFIAQDVEKAARETGYDFSGVDKPRNENSLYGLRYAEFVVPLVKAVQEQQRQIDELKRIIKELRK